jgi:Na+/pantothenate symporter
MSGLASRYGALLKRAVAVVLAGFVALVVADLLNAPDWLTGGIILLIPVVWLGVGVWTAFQRRAR